MNSFCMERMSLNCTDALPNGEVKCIEINTSAMSDRVLDRLNQDLEEFEKISLFFLMSAELPDAYEKIVEICENTEEMSSNIVAQFVKNNVNFWSDKLLEALCIINNREVLKNLGFLPRDIVLRYRQDISRFTVKIHPASKVLYKLFETMDGKKAKLLLQKIYEEDRLERKFTDNHYLELHALYWLSAKYITINPDGRGDLSKLFKHLKKMGYYGELIYFDVEYFSTNPRQSDSCVAVMPALTNGFHKIHVESDIPTDDKRQKHVEKYAINKGTCVIINEENFSKKYEKRYGTKKDGNNLRRTFKGLGFDVLEHEDLTRDDISKELEKVSENFDGKTHDCLVVVILSHGYEGGIISSDGIEIPIKVIEDAMCTYNLRDVPKILIIQACQGKITGDVSQNFGLALDGLPGITGKNSENIHRFRNFATFMSTMKGFNSIRHKEEGSWFIQAVCEVLSNPGRISVPQWSTAVTNKVRSKIGHVADCPAASQIPEFITRLEAVIYFPSYEEKRVVER